MTAEPMVVSVKTAELPVAISMAWFDKDEVIEQLGLWLDCKLERNANYEEQQQQAIERIADSLAGTSR